MPSRSVPFHSYAIPRIWGAMLDELRRHDWLSSDMRGQRAVCPACNAGVAVPLAAAQASAVAFRAQRVPAIAA